MSCSPPLPPPRGYSSWLEHAVATLDTRSLQNEHDWGNQPQWPEAVTREQMRAAAEAELQDLLFKAAKVDSVGVEDEILAASGGSADDDEFAATIRRPVADLEALGSRNEYLCLVHEGRRYWPRWQLRVPELRNILAVFAAREASSWSVAIWFTTPTDVLSLSNADERLKVRKSDSPLSLLLREGKAALPFVLKHASRFGEQGAQ